MAIAFTESLQVIFKEQASKDFEERLKEIFSGKGRNEKKKYGTSEAWDNEDYDDTAMEVGQNIARWWREANDMERRSILREAKVRGDENNDDFEAALGGDNGKIMNVLDYMTLQQLDFDSQYRPGGGRYQG